MANSAGAIFRQLGQYIQLWPNHGQHDEMINFGHRAILRILVAEIYGNWVAWVDIGTDIGISTAGIAYSGWN